MACCKVCCGCKDCDEGEEGKCCCGNECCATGTYCCNAECVQACTEAQEGNCKCGPACCYQGEYCCDNQCVPVCGEGEGGCLCGGQCCPADQFCCNGVCQSEPCSGCAGDEECVYCHTGDTLYFPVTNPPPTIHGCSPTFFGDDGTGVGLYVYNCYLPLTPGMECNVQYPDFLSLPDPPIINPVIGYCCEGVCQLGGCTGSCCCPDPEECLSDITEQGCYDYFPLEFCPGRTWTPNGTCGPSNTCNPLP